MFGIVTVGEQGRLSLIFIVSVSEAAFTIMCFGENYSAMVEKK